MLLTAVMSRPLGEVRHGETPPGGAREGEKKKKAKVRVITGAGGGVVCRRRPRCEVRSDAERLPRARPHRSLGTVLYSTLSYP